MGPRVLGGKTLQKLGGSYCPARTPGHIGNVGKMRFQTFGIVVVQRHAPAGVLCGHTGLQQGRSELVIGREQAAVYTPQSHHTGTGQRGNVHHCSRVKPFCIRQSITKNQAAFGIGVEHLDGLAAHAGDHVTGLHGPTIGHVFTGGDQAHHVHGGLQFGQGAEHPQHAGGTTHVKLHFVHFSRWLDGHTTRVKGNTLAHQHLGCLCLGRTGVMQHDKTQWLHRALRHGHERAHTELGHLFGAQHFTFDARKLGQRLGSVSQHGGGGVVARAVAPLLGQLLARDHRRALRKTVLHGCGVLHPDHHTLQLASIRHRLGGGVHITRLCSRLHHGAHPGVRWCCAGDQHQQAFDRLDPACRHTGQHGLAQLACRTVSCPDQHHTGRGNVCRFVQLQKFACFGLQITCRNGLGDNLGQGIFGWLEGVRHQQQDRITFKGCSPREIAGLEFKVHNSFFPSNQCYSIPPYARNLPEVLAPHWSS